MPKFYLSSPGPRPPFYRIAEHLWGAGCDIDSDGDSSFREATDWTELTIQLRPFGEDQRVDVDPIPGGERLVLKIRSVNPDLARRAATFLLGCAGGELVEA